MYAILAVSAIIGCLSLTICVGGVKLLRFKSEARSVFQDDTSSDETLPSVSVCIPARNETHAMTACLESVLSSDYKKLEIIVLDDSSNDDTSMLIKSFAHAGVRFLEGSPLRDGWLGKNHALQGLLDEASGAFILFMDVDTIIKPETISRLMADMRQRDTTMASVIPRRRDVWRMSVLFGSLRYLWTLLLASGRLPAVSSAFWCIKRDELAAVGGITAFKDVVQPEVAIAATLSHPHSFRTIMSNDQFDVSYEKKWSSQMETSVRLLSPLTGGGLRLVGCVILLLLLVGSLLAVPLGLVFNNFYLLFGGIMYHMSMTLLFSVYFSITWRRLWWYGGLFLWPFLIVQETWFLVVSIIQYARGEVSWKGRRIATRVQTH